MAILAVAVATSLLFLAGLHLFWGFGGRCGAGMAIPKKEDGGMLFHPGFFGCVAVAMVLAAMAWLALDRMAFIPTVLAPSFSLKLCRGVAALFGLRCIGDFHYFGLFCKVRATDFAIMDRKFYTPLCAFYAIAFMLLTM
jgi:hypothetical protein